MEKRKKEQRKKKEQASKYTSTVTKIISLEIGNAFSKTGNSQLPKQPCSEKDFEKENVIIYWILMHALLCGMTHSLRK